MLAMNRVGIIIPTMNRSEFVTRQLTYYSQVGCRHRIYIGDSSNDEHKRYTLDVIQQLSSSIDVVYNHYPDLNDAQAIWELSRLLEEPYAVYIGDDDFLVPNSLGLCADFLENHADYSGAGGRALLMKLEAEGAYGKILGTGEYLQGEVEAKDARERLLLYMQSYFVSLFYVQRTPDFRNNLDLINDMPDRSFTELLPCSLAVAKGKIKKLDCLSLVRQDHGFRYGLPGVFDWITLPAWSPSYQIYHERLVAELVQLDEISQEVAGDWVKQSFWAYLNRQLSGKYNGLYLKNEVDLSLSRKFIDSVLDKLSLDKEKVRRLMKPLLGGEDQPCSLGALLRGASPYHTDFMAIHAVLTSES
jgi:glycosyltransferase domain-containing protein